MSLKSVKSCNRDSDTGYILNKSSWEALNPDEHFKVHPPFFLLLLVKKSFTYFIKTNIPRTPDKERFYNSKWTLFSIVVIDWMLISLQNLYVEILIPNIMVGGGRVFRR